jgi:LPS sulfotransferase NodH
VFTAFSRLYTAFEESRSLIPPGQYCEIRYEQLVENPVETVRSIYQKLGIDSFEEMMPRLTSHVADFKDYRTNQYALDETTREQIREKWCDFMERYGYDRN